MSVLRQMRFIAERLRIPDILVIRPKKFVDPRGFFMEVYREVDFLHLGISCRFVQDNHSVSRHKGTIRGMHFQRYPEPQAKLLRVVHGSIFDVAVDLRTNSPTYGQWCGATLTAEGGEMFFVPAGFAHGFCTLEDDVRVIYKVDRYYSAPHDGGFAWNDPQIGIGWPLSKEQAILSDKDAKLPPLKDIPAPF